MTRFLYILLLIVSVAGCHSMPAERGKTVLAESRNDAPSNDFWAKTTRFFQPLLPESTEPQHAPNAAYTPVSWQTERPERKTQSLYRPGSIFPAPSLYDGVPTQETAQEEMPPAPPVGRKKPTNVLQAQDGDSERFVRLLTLIDETPREERGVNDAELARLLANFREDMQDESGREHEANYLAILRGRILPNYKPSKKAPVPEAVDDDAEDEQYAQAPPRKTTRKKRPPVVEDEEESPEDELYRREAIALKKNGRPQAPAPLSRETAAMVKESAQPVPPPAAPVYPGLTQLDGSTPNPVVPVHYVAAAPGTMNNASPESWQHHSHQAARLLRQQIESGASRSLSDEARLRLLELVNGNRNEAAKPFAQAEKPFNEFWGNQILGFSALVDDLGHPDARSRYVNAAFRFDESLMDLRRLCPIRLRNVRLARDVWAFGDYLPRGPECQAGEKIDVYLELENPTIRRTGDGYNVSASLGYEIRDNSGSVIDKFSNIQIQGTSQSRLRDYFAHLKITVPEDIAPGTYHLRICATDLNDDSMQFAEEQISLTVLPTATTEKRPERRGNVGR